MIEERDSGGKGGAGAGLRWTGTRNRRAVPLSSLELLSVGIAPIGRGNFVVSTRDPLGEVGRVEQHVGQNRALWRYGIAKPVSMDLDPTEAPARHSWIRPRMRPTGHRGGFNLVQRLAHGHQQVLSGIMAASFDIMLEQALDLCGCSTGLPNHRPGALSLHAALRRGILCGDVLVELTLQASKGRTSVVNPPVMQVFGALVQDLSEMPRYLQIVRDRTRPLRVPVHTYPPRLLRPEDNTLTPSGARGTRSS